MAASHVAVETGGKSRPRFRISAPASVSGMRALLHHFEQVAERLGVGGLGVHEEDRSSARSLARRLVDDLEATLLQVIERFLDVGHAQCEVRHAAAATVLLNLFGHRRFGRQGLEQLHQVRAVAHLQQYFPHLVAAQHVFAMHLLEAHCPIGLDVRFQLARLHRNGHMIEKEKSRYLLHLFIHYSNSATIWPACTPSPWVTAMAAIRPGPGAVILVSIFMASRTTRMSPVCRLCPTCAATRTTMPETGLRQTLSSFTGLLSAGGAAGAALAGTRSGAEPIFRPPALYGTAAGGPGSAASTSTSYVFPSIVIFSFMALPRPAACGTPGSIRVPVVPTQWY